MTLPETPMTLPEAPPTRAGFWVALLQRLLSAGERKQNGPFPDVVQERPVGATESGPSEAVDQEAVDPPACEGGDAPRAGADEPPQSEACDPQPAGDEPASGFDPQAALIAALDSLGQAHHRPFSRA
jgi:hypothetical protein